MGMGMFYIFEILLFLHFCPEFPYFILSNCEKKND